MCGVREGQNGGPIIQFFQGEAQSMRFVSTYSLQQAWRGLPQILEFLVIPREDGCTVAVDLDGPLTPLLARAYGPVIQASLNRLARVAVLRKPL